MIYSVMEKVWNMLSPTATSWQIKGFVHSLLSPPAISSPSLNPNVHLQPLYLPINLPLSGVSGEDCGFSPVILSHFICTLQQLCPVPPHPLRDGQRVI